MKAFLKKSIQLIKITPLQSTITGINISKENVTLEFEAR